MELSQNSLSTGDVKEAVRLPEGENINDWLSVNTVDFFNQLNWLFSSMIEKCTTEACPEMTAGPSFQYYWQDNGKFKKPTMLPAKEYIKNCLIWTEIQITDEKVFPSDPDRDYPKDFKKLVMTIFKRLFRIYAHIYYHHRDDIQELGCEEQLNTSFRQFVYFSKEFKLIPEDQLAPLKQIIDMLE